MNMTRFLKKKNDWLTDLSMIDLNMTMTWLWIEYELIIFQLAYKTLIPNMCFFFQTDLSFGK